MTTTSTHSRNHQTFKLWEGSPPNHQESELQEIAVTTDGALRISRVQDPTIEVHLPAGRHANGQAVVICPGGGYGILSYNWEGVDVANYLNAHGIAAIILKYRLPEKASNLEPHLSPLLDAKRALRSTRFNAKDWNVDPAQIGILGFSAGGHLATTLGTRFDAGDPSAPDPIDRLSSRPDFMILAYPVISMQAGLAHSGSRSNLLGERPSEELISYYSNEKQVTPATPPTFLVHSADDASVPVGNSLAFYEALLANGVEADMHLYQYGGHGYSLAIDRGRLSAWPKLCVTWIKEQKSGLPK